ncbi:MFS transporter [Niveispirillum cyanobacteriorum]|uniref:MFS transporter n=1 Tax=Niveispirillum cyanobacteriorum TaxID=1612173 RepID=A0A2K9NDG3_9PROT|nr:MFS transporter [Niveispirillum cyanobacteriorum]AUN31190.1 MFS transporter [Niveispirillum cyanobacteriorum]GGE86549.1 MFS transporter [Niveispirillum cyanobacteriorum]
MSDARSEFSQGWKVVVASALGIGTGLSPIPFYTIGVFVAPLSAEFGWAVDQIMFSLMIMTLGAVVMGPVAGILADRFGVRPVVLASVALFGLTLAGFALSNGSLTLFYINWMLMSALGAGTLPITWTRAVSNWFNTHRGLALGLSLLGTGLFGAGAKLYANYLIGAFGWRTAYIGLALLPLLLSLPTAYFLFRDTTDAKAKGAPVRQAHRGLTLRQAMKGYRFWLLALAFIPISFAVGGPIPNMEKIFTSKGIDVQQAVQIASIIGPSVIAGRIIGGWLIDRVWAPGVAFVLLSLPAIACWLLTGDATTPMVATFAVILIGFAAGVEYDMLAFLVSRYYGMRSYGAIYGLVYGFFAMGAGFGPYTFGRIFVQTGSYDTGLFYGAVMLLAGAASLLLLGRYPDPASFPVAEEK